MSSRFLARNALAGARVTLPRQATHLTQRRLASSEAMGDELVHERQHHKEHAGSAYMFFDTTFYLTYSNSPSHRVGRTMAKGITICVCSWL